MRCSGLLLIAALVSACATPPPATLPQGHAGPRVFVRESMKTHTEQPVEALKPYRVVKVDFFVVTAVNGTPVGNSLNETIKQNYGRGFALSPVLITHQIAPGPVRLSVLGKTHHPAPVLAVLRGVREIEGDVSFDARAEKDYVVRGELTEDRLSVWIEEDGTGIVVGKKVERLAANQK
jgi:hypothetical protein